MNVRTDTVVPTLQRTGCACIDRAKSANISDCIMIILPCRHTVIHNIVSMIAAIRKNTVYDYTTL